MQFAELLRAALLVRKALPGGSSSSVNEAVDAVMDFRDVSVRLGGSLDQGDEVIDDCVSWREGAVERVEELRADAVSGCLP